MPIAVGERLPDVTFKVRENEEFVDRTTKDIFGGKKVVLIGLPGAFTPTCSMNHLPGFLDNRDAILAKGVNEIAVVAVNDHHVMRAWAEASGGKGKIAFLPDGRGDFARGIGMELDMGPMGKRSLRYSMIVEDGVVKEFNAEKTMGVDQSGADHILTQL
jgi:glutaredoxin/glutathione-dependent peroxiredoxin